MENFENPIGKNVEQTKTGEKTHVEKLSAERVAEMFGNIEERAVEYISKNPYWQNVGERYSDTGRY